MIWAFFFLAGLLFTKYYTEATLRGLRAKTRGDQKTLADARQALAAAQEKRASVEKEEKTFKTRLDKLQAIITDMEVEIQESVVRVQKGLPLGVEMAEEEKEG
ncbi:MAG: hypothetical protein A3F84_22975 [Candidatus Handelsmanbacteria bacterium RIFCSPLOWO2_12_FULL_64_10]|uniref:Uncharacterized protein n=1 Tax=Handelsmanbacteria sp. (strain RIFCSPLOWO2_12_FULL_64_10) TaxID=1817868 RepID=A0A1F6CGL4_HANXR|nr:MAG: hypothetical protein A3F84_22975 [Candidatus Handelsmanbacteria bacterium RIFCSPLOWO2_12_FULL_64_10]